MIPRCSLVILIAMAFMTVTGGWAQQSLQPPPPLAGPQLLPPHNQQPPLPDNPLRVLSRFFQLRPEQVEGVVRLLEVRRRTVEPLLKEIASREADLRDLIAAEADALLIGNAVIALDGLRKQVQEAHRQFTASFEQLLTPDQRSQLQALRRAVRLQLFVNAARELGVI